MVEKRVQRGSGLLFQVLEEQLSGKEVDFSMGKTFFNSTE